MLITENLRKIGQEGFALIDKYYGTRHNAVEEGIDRRASDYIRKVRMVYKERGTGEERWAGVERAATEKERQAKADKVAKEQKDRACLVAEEERRAMVEREAKEKGQAREYREAGVERRVRAEKEVEEQRESEEKRWAMAEREAEEERQARAKRGEEKEKEKEEQAKEEKERQDKAEEERRARAKRMEEITNGETLYKAICENNWTRAKESLDKNPSVLTTKITSSGKTALHVAALFGHVSLVEELVKLVPPQFLETTDDFGNTPLLIATVTGITPVAECLVNKNSNILGLPNSTNELPVTLAFLNGHQEMGRYLYSQTPLRYLHQENAYLQGAMLLHCCFQTQSFGM